MVDRAGHVRDQVRVAVADAADEGADLDPLGHLRHRRQQAPALEVAPVGIAVEGEEVIPGEERIGADRLRLPPCRPAAAGT